MYDIRQFKPTLFLVLFLGMTGFALSAEAPLLWLFSIAALTFNAYLVHSGRFTPVPRWLANAATLLALFYITWQVLLSQAPPLLYIGEFLVLLQVIKLFEARANRDYAQMLILSLLLMVAAAITASSLAFAVLMLVYLVIALYACLLFHLKSETDRAMASFPVPADQVHPATLRQDKRFLARSMKRLTALVAVVSVSVSVVVFLAFPRGTGAGVLGQFQLRQSQPLTGFSDRASYDQVARIQQNHEVIAQLFVARKKPGDTAETPLKGPQDFLLRAITYDTYGDPLGERLENRYAWSHSPENVYEDPRETGDDRQPMDLLRRPGPDETVYHQRFTLKPTGSKALFALAGPFQLSAGRNIQVKCSPTDESLRSADAVFSVLEYDVWSTGKLGRPTLPQRVLDQATAVPPRSDPNVLREIEKFTRNPDIIGQANVHRSRLVRYDPSNREIATKIEHFLRSQYKYSLDLTDAPEFRRDKDPVVVFLTEVKRGHCEYFAGAMALMCQSIGIPARYVIGFSCGDEYNAVGGYYNVRQSHAHAWVEVLTEAGWETFDPTSGTLADSRASGGFFSSIRNFFDFLDYKWGEKVILYDRKSREGVIADADRNMTNLAIRGTGWMNWLRGREVLPLLWKVFSNLLGLLIGLMIAAIVVAIGIFIAQYYRLRRRARRIGLGHLPASEQVRLARKLAFYDELTRLLEERKITRPPHLTPREFGNTLSFLPPLAYADIRRLTNVFYRVRFGAAELPYSRRRRLQDAVERLGRGLGKTA